MCFFAARSVREIALMIFLLPFLLLAIRVAASKLARMCLFTSSFFFELLRALLAVLVTGILFSHFSFVNFVRVSRRKRK